MRNRQTKRREIDRQTDGDGNIRKSCAETMKRGRDNEREGKRRERERELDSTCAAGPCLYDGYDYNLVLLFQG